MIFELDFQFCIDFLFCVYFKSTVQLVIYKRKLFFFGGGGGGVYRYDGLGVFIDMLVHEIIADVYCAVMLHTNFSVIH